MKTRKTMDNSTTHKRTVVPDPTSVDTASDSNKIGETTENDDDLLICQICNFKTSDNDTMDSHMKEHVQRKTRIYANKDSEKTESGAKIQSNEMTTGNLNEKAVEEELKTEKQDNQTPSLKQSTRKKGIKLMNLVNRLKSSQTNTTETEKEVPNEESLEQKKVESSIQDNSEKKTIPSSQTKTSEVVKLLESTPTNPNVNYATDFPDRRKQSPQQRATNGKKSFECDVCGYRAKWLSELQKHKLVHTNEKPFPCPHCTHRSRWKGDLTRHIQKIHKIFIQPQRSRKSSKSKVKDNLNKTPVLLVPLNKCPLEPSTPANGNFMAFPGMFPSDKSNGTSVNSQQINFKPTNQPLQNTANAPQAELESKNNEIPTVSTKPKEPKTLLEQQLSEAPKINNQFFNSENALSPSKSTQVVSSPNSSAGSDQGASTVKKMVYKCHECNFYTKTASRFHVHVVQHLNMRPYMCSDCGYRSNWQWDVTKHIKVKVSKLDTHQTAEVLLIHEAGEKNYEKYKPFLEFVEEKQPQSNDSDNKHTELTEESHPKNNIPTETESAIINFQEHFVEKSVHQCKLCGYQSNDIENLQHHIIISHLKKYFLPGQKCPVILRDFDISKQLYNINQDQNSELFICSVCSYKTRNSEYANFHIKQHYPKPEATNRCLFCPYWVMFKKNLLKHYNLHVLSPATFLMELESLTILNVSTNDNFNINGDNNEEECDEDSESSSPKRRKFSCDRCPYTSKNRSQYLYHMQFHEKDANMVHKCSKCDYSVSHLHLLQQHLKLHENPLKENLQIFEEKPESPSEDNNGITNKHDLVSETPVADQAPGHSNSPNRMIKMYKCRYCPLVNKRRANVKTHELMHTKIKGSQYTCALCNYRCDGQGALTSHMKIHDQKEINYTQQWNNEDSSDQVQTVYLDEANIPRQRVKSGNGNLVQCPKCPSMFKTIGNLQNHQKLHGSNYQFQCSFCDYAAKFKPHLQNHMKVHLSSLSRNSVETFQEKQTESEIFQTNPTKIASEIENMFAIPLAGTDVQLMRPRKRASVPSFKCTKCPAKFSKNIRLRRHLSLHGAIGKFICKLCDYSVNNSIAYQKHGQLHVKAISAENNEVPLQTYQQPTDFKKTTKKSFVNADEKITQIDNRIWLQQSANHVRVKLGDSESRIFSCTHCPYIHHRKDAVQNHLKRHIQQNGSFKCPYCDYNVLYDSFLKEHVKLHLTPQIIPKFKAPIENIEIHAINSKTNESEMIFKHKRYKDSNDEMYYPEIPEDDGDEEKDFMEIKCKKFDKAMKNSCESKNLDALPKEQKCFPLKIVADDVPVRQEKENSTSDLNSQKRYMEVMDNLESIEDLYSVINEYLHSGGSVSCNQTEELKGK